MDRRRRGRERVSTLTLDDWAAGFEAEALAAAEATEAADRRLDADLERFPDSPTLTALAIRDEAGAVVGMGSNGASLEIAYTSGADASLIVGAERLAAVIGQPGDRGYLYRLVRLAHAVRAMNRSLAAFSGVLRTLGTVTVRLGWWAKSPTAADLDADAEALAESSHESEGDPDPPLPLDAATTSPHRPCAPPTSHQRGQLATSRRHGREPRYSKAVERTSRLID
jgi:hypothetical protein